MFTDFCNRLNQRRVLSYLEVLITVSTSTGNLQNLLLSPPTHSLPMKASLSTFKAMIAAYTMDMRIGAQLK